MGSYHGDEPASKLDFLLEVVRLECEEGLGKKQVAEVRDVEVPQNSEPVATAVMSQGMTSSVSSQEQHSQQGDHCSQDIKTEVVLKHFQSQVMNSNLVQQEVRQLQVQPERQVEVAPIGQQGRACGNGKILTGGPCESCGTTESPQWRRPDPARIVLCNRCGIHYSRYKKLPGKKKQGAQDSLGLISQLCSTAMVQPVRLERGADAASDAANVLRDEHVSSNAYRVMDGAAVRPVVYSRSIVIPKDAQYMPHPTSVLLRAQSRELSGVSILAEPSDHKGHHDRLVGQGAVEYILTHGHSLDFKPVRHHFTSSRPSHHMHPSFEQPRMQQQHVLYERKRTARELDEEENDGGVGKKAALQRKLQVCSMVPKIDNSNRCMYTVQRHGSPEAEHNAASPSTESQIESEHREYGCTYHHAMSSGRDYPEPFRGADRYAMGSHLRRADSLIETTIPNYRGVPASKQPHFLLVNGVLTRVDGSPVDAATYHNVLASLMEQRAAVAVPKDRIQHVPGLSGRPDLFPYYTALRPHAETH